MLTADAFGVMPPIAKLSPSQAMYHFLSGFTARVAGTEKGMGSQPEPTFSTCFGAPFMPLHPSVYGNLLRDLIDKYDCDCWLVNTGWTGGSFGLGKRISIRHTRALLNAALSGKLTNVPFRADPVFGFEVPTECEGIPSQILDPASTWPSRDEYDQKYQALAARFIENFKLMTEGCPEEIIQAGPKLAPRRCA
jgi:phosphoenolpyruvate carboxykinase (ATP)